MRKNFNKRAGFSLIEIVVVIAIMAIIAALLVPALIHYTEDSRAQKDVTTMDEVVNAVQLALADSDCFDEMELYSCDNNFITYTDSSGKYGQQVIDAEYWAPDGYGKATTITFNPEKAPNGDTIYRLENAIINDMTFGNGSIGSPRVMEGNMIDNNQCYLPNAKLYAGLDSGYTFNKVKQTIGTDIITTSATYANSSFTIFIRFSQKDSVTVADVSGSFNGTNLTQSSNASVGSGTNSEVVNPDTGNKEQGPATNPQGGTTSNSGGGYSSLAGSGVMSGNTDYQNNNNGEDKKTGRIIPPGGTYYVKAGSSKLGKFDNAVEVRYAGEFFPDTCEIGDAYTYGDYEYRYKYRCETNNSWVEVASQVGWGARARDTTKTNYNEMLGEINLQPLTKIVNAYNGCTKITSAPRIPSTVTHAGHAFYNCSALADPPALPSGMVDAGLMFANCTSLTKTPKFPDGLGQMASMFAGCTSLTTIEKLPRLAYQLAGTFRNCDALVSAPDMSHITAKTVNMELTFADCANLTTVTSLPPNTTTLKDTFNNCPKLRNFTAVVPAKVKNMDHTFYDCTQLTGTIKIESNIIESMTQCFYNVRFSAQNLNLTGSSTQLEALKATGLK